MKVSIIIPIYNVEKYLRKCIYSVLNQTFTDFECILVDDGSPDRCGEICDEYAAKDGRIKVIHQNNNGVSAARNVGMEIAKGEYIYFVDADDYIDRDLLFEAINHMSNKNFDMVSFSYRKIGADGKLIDVLRYPKNEYMFSSDNEYIDFICNDLGREGGTWSPCTNLFKSDIIKKENLRFYDRSKICGEDVLFYLLFLIHSKTILVIDKALYNYVAREDSYTLSSKDTRVNELVELNKEFYRYLKNNKRDTLLNKFYIMFYAIMRFRYWRYPFEDILNSVSCLEDKKFFRHNVVKIIIHANEMARTLSDVNRNALLYENLQYYLHLSDNALFKAVRGLLKKYSDRKTVSTD